MPKRLITISGKDWMKGFSIQKSFPIGGIFSEMTNFDPFERMGFLQPARVPTRYANATITKTIRYMTGMDISGPFIIGFADGGGATALYKINAITGAATDEVASITSATNARGLLFAKNRLLYANPTAIRSVSATLTGDASVLTGLTDGEHPMVMGADLNIYGVDGGAAANQIFRIADASSTSGNSLNVFALETGMFIRSIKNDGRHLVMVADNRQTSSSGIGNYDCCVAYWNYADETLVARYSLKDSGMFAVEIDDDGSILVFGGNNIYVSNVVTQPTPIFSFKGDTPITSKPGGSPWVIKKNSSVLWGDSGGSKIHGYGNQVVGQKKVFFAPYDTGDTSITAIVENAGQVWAATDTPALYGFWDTATARATASLVTAPILFDRVYKITNFRVVTRAILASGETVSVEILKQGGGAIISDQQDFTFAANGAKQVRIFGIDPGTNTTPNCQEIDEIQIDTNACIESIEIWGEEIPWNNQEL